MDGVPIPLPHRDEGNRLLAGEGIEIGAFNCPAPVPPGGRVRYVDVCTRAEAKRRFPEVDEAALVEPDLVCDMDRGGLAGLADRSLDFVLCNHVLEHVANPVRALGELFRVLRPGGHAAIGIPDKDYTFDRPRAVTPWAHFADDYARGVTENDDGHYLDFLRHVAPHVFTESGRNLADEVARARQRRDHAHVWTSASFRDFMDRALPLLGVRARCVFERTGAQTRIEYYGIWRKRRRWWPAG